MTPFHPKLRRALLKDLQRRKLHLTGQELKQYEVLSKQLEDETYYATADNFLSYTITEEVISKIEKNKEIPTIEEIIRLLQEWLKEKKILIFFSKKQFLRELETIIGKLYLDTYAFILKEAGQPYFTVTEETLRLLRFNKIPMSILTALEKLKYQKIIAEEEFLEKLNLSHKEKDKTIKLIINYSMRPGLDPSEKLENFTNEFWPKNRYDDIKKKFAKDQLQALKLSYYELNPYKIIKKSLLILKIIFCDMVEKVTIPLDRYKYGKTN